MIGTNDTQAPAVQDGDMSAFDLARWRLNDLIYARKVSTDQGPAFEVYAADGTFLFTLETMGQVLATAKNNEMDVATLH